MKNAFRHPVTGVLTAWGYVDTNRPGEIMSPVSDDFILEPGKWRWDGTQWVEFIAPIVLSDLAKALDTALSTTTLVTIKTVLQEWRKQVS